MFQQKESKLKLVSACYRLGLYGEKQGLSGQVISFLYHFYITEQNERSRAVARALIGGEVYIHIFELCSTNFFLNQLLLGLISKEISRRRA